MRGQGLVEFAIILPILVLFLLLTIDFGRVFFGWVGLQNAARIGANYAAQYPTANWGNPSDPRRQEYESQLDADAAAINCAPVSAWPTPGFPEGTGPGDDAVVSLECDFSFITPLVGGIVGEPLRIAAEATFPIRYGLLGSPSGPPPDPEDPCAQVPNVVGGTVAEARDAWRDRGFTGGFIPVTGFDDDTVTDQRTAPPSEPETECIPLTSTITVESGTAEGCASGELVVPLVEGRTVGEARTLWNDKGFTGGFSPSGQNSQQVLDQSPEQGTCQPETASMTVVFGPPPPPPQCTAPDFVGKSTSEAPGLWSIAEFTGEITYRSPPPFVVRRQSLVAGRKYDCTASVELRD
jgi:hypothetical protein